MSNCTAQGLAVAEQGIVLDVLVAQQFDLLLSDLGLPVGDGFDLMKSLAKSGNIRGVALTSFDQPENIERTRAAGFSAHLVKPVGFDALKETIEKTLQYPQNPSTRDEQ
jgi:CheY-like chemotaxis protein